MKIIFSVVMNCYNSEAYIKEAINSVLTQSFINFELVICDNHSLDSTVNIIESFNDQRIRLVKTMQHCPLGEARNQALSFCRGEYIAFLDSDDVWITDKLSIQLNAFINNPDVDFIYSNYYFLNFTNPVKFRRKIGFRNPQPSGDIFGQVVTNYKISISSVVIRSEIFRDGHFRFKSNFQQIEEFDLFTRILYKHKAHYVNKPLALYRVHPQMNTVISPERGVIEYKDLLNSYNTMDDRFKDNNPVVVNYIKAKLLAYVEAKYRLVYGDYHLVRSSLNGYAFYDYRNLFLYIISFFPKKLIRLFLS
jgi:glycosyltransferase involved in cell wall biosynthesis